MTITDRYKDCNVITQEYLKILCDSIEHEYGEIDGPYLLSLDLIADNYELLLLAKEDIKLNGLKQYDKANRLSKNDSIQIFNTAQTNITRLLNNFGKTPMSKSKIKQIDNNEEDLSNLLDA